MILVNGASPCNVHWQVGTSASLGTTAAFQGNLMALASISLTDGASVLGRLLARSGQVSLIHNVITRPLCPAEPTPDTEGSSETAPASVTSATGTAKKPAKSARGSNRSGPGNRAGAGGTARKGTAVVRSAPREACTDGFRATVSGRMIERVVFSLDGKRIGSREGAPFAMSVRATPGSHRVGARVFFKDATRAKTMSLPYRACAAALLQPRNGPAPFTG